MARIVRTKSRKVISLALKTVLFVSLGYALKQDVQDKPGHDENTRESSGNGISVKGLQKQTTNIKTQSSDNVKINTEERTDTIHGSVKLPYGTNTNIKTQYIEKTRNKGPLTFDEFTNDAVEKKKYAFSNIAYDRFRNKSKICRLDLSNITLINHQINATSTVHPDDQLCPASPRLSNETLWELFAGELNYVFSPDVSGTVEEKAAEEVLGLQHASEVGFKINAADLAMMYIKGAGLFDVVVVIIEGSDQKYVDEADSFINLAMDKYHQMLITYELDDYIDIFAILDQLRKYAGKKIVFIMFSPTWNERMQRASRYLTFRDSKGSTRPFEYFWIIMLYSAQNFNIKRDETAYFSYWEEHPIRYDNVALLLETNTTFKCGCELSIPMTEECTKYSKENSKCPCYDPITRAIGIGKHTSVHVYTLMWYKNRERYFDKLQCSPKDIPDSCEIFPISKYGLNNRNILIITKSWFHYVQIERDNDRYLRHKAHDLSYKNMFDKSERLNHLHPSNRATLDAMTSLYMKFKCPGALSVSCPKNDCHKPVFHGIYPSHGKALLGFDQTIYEDKKAYFSGMLVDVLESLADKLNFTYSLIGFNKTENNDCDWDSLTNLTNDNAMLFDLSLAIFDPLQDTSLDYATPIERTVFELVTIPKDYTSNTDWLTGAYFVQPFNSEMYMLFFISIVIALVLNLIITNIEAVIFKQKDQRYIDVLFGTVGSVLNQGTLRQPLTLSGRAFGFCWSFFLVMTYAIYTGSLTARTAVVKVQSQNLKSLLDDHSLEWGVRGDLPVMAYIRRTRDNTAGNTRRLYDRLIESNMTEPNPSVHHKRLLAGNYIYLTHQVEVTELISHYCTRGLAPLDGVNFQMYTGFALPAHSGLTAHITRGLRALWDTNLMDAWHSKWKPYRTFRCPKIGITDRDLTERRRWDKGDRTFVKRDQDSSVDLTNMSTLFVMCGCGMVLATAILTVERLFEPVKNTYVKITHFCSTRGRTPDAAGDVGANLEKGQTTNSRSKRHSSGGLGKAPVK